MVEWSNWSGRITASPQEVRSVATHDDVVAAVRSARGAGLDVRAAGATHSHAPLIPTDGVVLDTIAMSGMRDVDTEARTATIAAGTRIADLGEPLLAQGLGLINQGDIDQQSIAGALATGTHGTGVGLKNLSASLLGATLVTADGETLHCSADEHPEVFEAARVSLGALGIITEVTLGVRDAYRLDEHGWLGDIDEVMGDIDRLTTATRHFEFFWSPQHDRAFCKAIDETQEPVVEPLGKEGERRAWSFQVLANVRTDKHTEMEYSVPAELGPACFAEIRQLLKTRYPDVTWPVEYRTLAADDLLISTASGRETVTISIHEGVENDERAYYRDAEEIFRAHEGRPHWGKVNHVDAAGFADMYGDAWTRWWAVRDGLDPEERFLNHRLREIAPR